MNYIENAERILARLAREDFTTFVELVGKDNRGRPLNQRPLDRLVWAFVKQCHAHGYLAGVMVPMGFGKTTQFCYRAAWELGRDPNRQICIVTDAAEESKERLVMVRAVLDTPEYKLVFPHIQVVVGHDDKSRFTVVRTGYSKDPRCADRNRGAYGLSIDGRRCDVSQSTA